MNFATEEPPFRFTPGTRPLLISVPHGGTHVPRALADRLTPAAHALADTDWHQERLYQEAAKALGASLLVATHSRYVIDLNRPPDDASLYPGKSVTGLCPVDTFADEPLYVDSADRPDDAEKRQRLNAIWKPYHAQLSGELARLRQAHGQVALWDAHSICSVVPRFFDGKLDDLNLGTADGESCDEPLGDRLLAIAQTEPRYTAVLNGRFKGGYITRHYGRPAEGVQAVQLEMTWRCYMHEHAPYPYAPERAAQVQPLLLHLLETMLEYVEAAR